MSERERYRKGKEREKEREIENKIYKRGRKRKIWKMT